MKVSLNKLNKLRNAIEELPLETECQRLITFRISSDASVDTLKKEIEEAKQKFEASFAELSEREEMLYTVRELIHGTNMESDASTVIGEIASHERILSFLNKFKDIIRRTPNISVEDFRNRQKFEEMKFKAGKIESLQAPSIFNVSAVDDNFTEYLDKSIKDIKLLLEELKEKRNEINHSIQVELPKKVFDFLVKHSLLKA